MKIHTEAPTSCNVDEMVDGDVAVIVKWPTVVEYAGLVVQRYKTELIALGIRCELCCPNFFSDGHDDSFLVHILSKGTLIEI